MDAPAPGDPLTQYLAHFDPLIGDARTRRLFGATVTGLLTCGSTICAQIAAHSPQCAGPHGAQRVRRFVHGTTTQRSHLDAPALTAALRQRTLTRLQAAPPDELWLVLDGSDLRKPHARQLEYLDRVPRLDGGIGPGYHTLTVLAVAPGLRGVLYQTVYSTRQPGFRSESLEIQTALSTVIAAVQAALPQTPVVWIMDREYDDLAVWRTIWHAGQHVVCRVKHRERLVRYYSRTAQWQEGHLTEAGAQLRRRATLETELEVRLHGQRQAKRQRVTVDLAQGAVAVGYDPRPRTEEPSGQLVWQRANLVEAAIRDCPWAPWWLLTDLPARQAAAITHVFTAYRTRWSVEEAFHFTKTCVDWEAVQVLKLVAVQRLVALAWVAAGYLYELGVTLEEPAVHLLARLGGWEGRAERPPGRIVLQRGLGRLLDMLATAALLAGYEATDGGLPPQIEAFLQRGVLPSDL
jgi:DDE family transposase